jgi:ABC-type multidrug transport system ATPase subunit
MLTLQQSGGTPYGSITVNGMPLTSAIYNDNAAYVEQTDTLWASLTAKDHLEYAVALHRPNLSKEEQGEDGMI